MTLISDTAPRIALIHALEESVLPARAAFAAHWPEAKAFDLLDTSLATDLAARGRLDEAMTERFLTLGRYAAATEATSGRARAILFTCSAFGPAIDAVAADLDIPVHKPNSAMIERAVALANGGRIGLVATFEPTLQSMPPEFPEGTDLTLIHVAGALSAAQAGDGAEHDRLAGEAVAAQGADCAVIALSQFSLARARFEVERRSGKPVLVTPDCAVEAIRAALVR